MAEDRPRERLEATVVGRVQGVGYRYFVVREARDLDLSGWVANEPDGSVTVVAEGLRHHLVELVRRLETGPPAASVRHVVTAWLPATGRLVTFGVRSGGHAGD